MVSSISDGDCCHDPEDYCSEEEGIAMGFGGDDFMGTGMGLGQYGFMAEAEGCDDLVDTPDARFNAALKEIKSSLEWARGNDFNVTSEVNEILVSHGVTPSEMSPSQVSRIRRVVA